jgi:transcriptional regulator with GAF, ATPase, and Fis domain
MTDDGGDVLPGAPPADPGPGEAYLREYAPLFAASPRMQAIRQMIEEVASTSAAVLIRGESGVGKEVVARAIHSASTRRDQPFVKVNCAALPAELLESELFGHEKGSFTGAYRRKLGKFEFANRGSIFLDEIGELPRSLQAKLLHVLQDYEFSRIGGQELIRVDTRVIAATNRNLEAAMANGEFREDLYYRLNVVEIRVPPLRERRDEIEPLVAGMLARFNREYHRSVTLSRETMERFDRYPWPGNIRELDNVMRRLVLLGNPRQIHDELDGSLRAATLQTSGPWPARAPDRAHDLPGAAATPEAPAAAPPPGASAGRPFPGIPPGPPGSPADVSLLALGLKEIARRAALDAERRALQEVLDRLHWNRTEAARILKVSYKTLLTKITECGLSRPRSQP